MVNLTKMNIHVKYELSAVTGSVKASAGASPS